MNLLNEELLQEQLQLEEESVVKGVESYLNNLDSLRKASKEHITYPAQQMIKRNLDNLAEAIRIDTEHALKKVAGKRRSTVALSRSKLLQELSYEAIAYHTLNKAFQSISTNKNSVSFNAIQLSHTLCDQISFQNFKKLNKDRFNITQQHIKRVNSEHKRVAVMRKIMRNENIDRITWPVETSTQVGNYLLDLLVSVTDLFEIKKTKKATNARSGNFKVEFILVASPKLLDWLSQGHEICAHLAPLKYPMVIPPVRWDSPKGGGYVSMYDGGMRLMKSGVDLEELKRVDMPEVYSALNRVQETPWAINKKVLEVAKMCWDLEIPVGPKGKEVLPTQSIIEPEPFPEEWSGNLKGWKEADPLGYKQWAMKARNSHDDNNSNASKRTAVLAKFNVAEKFKDHKSIYFPHNLDFRGRMYAVPQFLNPQGDDLAKGLIQFSEGKALGDTGLKWLFIHCANCFGVDKVTFEERRQWTDDNLEHLIDSAMDPIYNQFWMEADDPFQALAVCFELLEFSLQRDNFKSHLSIPQDGSCNGLQNFSALLRDEVGGAATNLIPAEEPSDIYTEVLDLVKARVRQDALEGKLEAICVDGLLVRSIVKQPVMTLPYGATVRGMSKQITTAIEKHLPGKVPTKHIWSVSLYLAQVTYDCIGEVVIAARSAMSYLQEVAKVLGKEGSPVRWTTPIGLPVVQNYRKTTSKQVELFIGGQRARLTVSKPTFKIDTKKQTYSISPNFIHSMDSSHLMSTVLLGYDYGIKDFSMIHDSFGTHACDTDLLHECIRSSFITMYSTDILKDWTDEVMTQISPESFPELPEIPPSGKLDLLEILDSDYFFA